MMRTRRLAGWLACALFWGATGISALACPICFRMDDGPMADGVRAAVVVLMAVTICVLGCFGRFVVRLAKAEPVEPVEPA